MGITVTTNLGLIKPDVDEKIKEDLPTFAGWASQNEDNMDKIDSLFRASVHSYTPTWGSNGGVAPTLGAGGSVEGKYIRLWPRMVVVFFRINTGGAGFNPGTAVYTLSLPVAIDPEFSDFTHTLPLGKMTFFDASAALTSTVMPLVYSPSAALMFARPSEGGTWSATLPVAPAQTDRYSGYFMYPTAVA